jgi:hypothetical protein
MLFDNYQLHWKYQGRTPDGKHIVAYIMSVISEERSGLRLRELVFSGMGQTFAEATLSALHNAVSWIETNAGFINASSGY